MIPHNDAGILTLPPVSVPIAKVVNPLLTETADPELEPPGTFAIFHGFLQVLVVVLMPNVPNANSTKFVLPKITDFEFIKSSVILAFLSAIFPSSILEPAVVILPLTSTKSFNPIGIPINLFSFLFDMYFSASLASSIASFSYTFINEFKSLSCFFILSKKTFVTSVGDVFLFIYSSVN